MREFEFTQPNDPLCFTPPIYNGPQFVCNVCCGNGTLLVLDDCLVWDCPDHLQVTFHNGRVVSAMTRGARS